MPNFPGTTIADHWMDFLTPLAVGGLWLAYFLWQLQLQSAAADARPQPGIGPSSAARSMRKRPRRSKRRSLMPEEIHSPEDRLEHPSVHNEKTDASFPAILWILIGSAIFAVVMFLDVTWFFTSSGAHEAEVKQSPFPLAPYAVHRPARRAAPRTGRSHGGN